VSGAGGGRIVGDHGPLCRRLSLWRADRPWQGEPRSPSPPPPRGRPLGRRTGSAGPCAPRRTIGHDGRAVMAVGRNRPGVADPWLLRLFVLCRAPSPRAAALIPPGARGSDRCGGAGGAPGTRLGGACPNLPQRRSEPGSAVKKSAEYQRFFSRAPARSGPLWQIWTTGALGPGGEGVRGSGGGRCGRPDDRGDHFDDTVGPTGAPVREGARHPTRSQVASPIPGPRRDAVPGEEGSMRAQLAEIHLSSHDVSSARQNPPELDSCELSSHNVS